MRPVRPWRRWLGVETPPCERLTAVTADGVALAIHRVRPAAPRGEPVLLLHGLGANRLGLHFPGRSFAAHLADAGFDCFVPELRGAGESGTRHWRWDFEDHLRWDIPAVLDAIANATGRERVHWVGHSMGGLLLLAHGVTSDRPRLSTGFAIGSALDYAVGGSAFERVLALRPVLARLPVIPWGGLVHLLSPLLGRFGGPLERFNFAAGASEPEVCRAIHANGFGPIPTSLLLSLASTFEPGGLSNRDGTVRYLERARRFPVPLRFVAGTADRQCPVETARTTARAFGAEVIEVEGYGHFDLVVGREAPRLVWARVAEWLERRVAA